MTQDLAVADTLRPASLGDLVPVPNPIVVRTAIFFSLADTQWVEFNILDLGGRTVRRLAAEEIPPGFSAVIWDGLAQGGAPATESMYWATFVSGDDIRAHLLFR